MILLAVCVLGKCAVAVAILLRRCCISCVLHNDDADLRCNKRAGPIVAPMMQRNHRDLHLVLGLVFCSHRWTGLGVFGVSGRRLGLGCQVLALAVGVYAGLLLLGLAVCVSELFSLSLLATARGGASFLGP